MKLRNKKTGEIKTSDKVGLLGRNGKNVWSTGEYGSLAELNEEWEDYEPKEPLIKDKKIRKAVRAWAETNEMELSDTVHYSPGFYKFEGTYCSIDFKMPIRELECRNYTIAELCGEEE